ncbi:MAG: class I SAM-dependent methyltransferase [Chlamydiota bacterium]
MTFGTRKEYEYFLCHRCKSLSIREGFEALNNLYENYPHLCAKLTSPTFLEKILLKFLFSKNRYLSMFGYNLSNSYRLLACKSLYPSFLDKSKKILDVGCGNGSFVSDLLSSGFNDVRGVDPNLADNSCNKKLNLTRKSIFQISGVYDLVIFNHSFEHMDNLSSICKRVEELLSPGGICIVRIPNVDSLSFRLFRENWEGIHAPFHIVLPSRKAIKKLFLDANLEHIEERSEQPYQLFFYSLNRLMNIADFEKFGAKRFFMENCRKRTPPLFTRRESKFLKIQAKKLKWLQISDYTVHYFKKC